ncbi:MAG: class I SAM-dependent methyltransferase [Chloroflexaceae bacterium]|nr:class I SAM-dependent methyltransferase [Chloroflexaceae bacterium]
MGENVYLSGKYAEKNATYHVEDSDWKAQHILRMIRNHQLPVRSVCEVGCGAGEILRQLYLSMPDEVVFTGYEISPQAFALCRNKEQERLRFFCDDFLSRDTPRFDLLLCIDVFEHVEDYMGFLRALKQKAAYKLFHIPLDISVQDILRKKPVSKRDRVGHLHYFMKETALLTLKDTGYDIIDWFYTAGSLDLARSVRQKLMALPRKMFFTHIHQDLAVRILGGYSLLVLTT